MLKVAAGRAPVIAGAWVAIVAVTAWAYRDIAHQQLLHWDDIRYLVENPHLRELSLRNLAWMFTGVWLSNWHPLTWLSLGLDHALWGLNAPLYKLENVALHLLCSAALMLLTVRLMQRARTPGPALPAGDSRPLVAGIAAAALFALHPQHVESVVWVAERKDILCGLFYVLAIICYVNGAGAALHRRWHTLMLLSAALALASKPMAVTLPLVLMVLDIHPLRRFAERRGPRAFIATLLQNKIGLLLMSAGVAAITLIAQRHEVQGLAGFGLEARLVSAALAVLHYLRALLFPVGLAAFYPFHPWVTQLTAWSAAPVAAVAVLCVAQG